jgi:hypothetical protein
MDMQVTIEDVAGSGIFYAVHAKAIQWEAVSQ